MTISFWVCWRIFKATDWVAWAEDSVCRSDGKLSHHGSLAYIFSSNHENQTALPQDTVQMSATYACLFRKASHIYTDLFLLHIIISVFSSKIWVKVSFLSKALDQLIIPLYSKKMFYIRKAHFTIGYYLTNTLHNVGQPK